ncbi:MAG: hypothetical protein MUF78_01850 [Candidatus Edwardsbacteria bacterium]|nr:hypothetical protein [Candidatus Edwardsbacteria bacterium]
MTGPNGASPASTAAPRSGFWAESLDALRYPLRPRTLLFLAAAALGLTVKPLVAGLLGPGLAQTLQTPLVAVAGVTGLAALVLLPQFFVDIIRRSAAGEDAAPAWPGFPDPAALLARSLKMVAVLLWPLLPLLLYAAALGDRRPSIAAVAALLALAALYLPMSLLRLAVTGRLWPSLLPSNVIEPVVASFRRSWKIWLATLAVLLYLPASALPARIPVAGPTIAVLAGLYCWSCLMRALGRFYGGERERLNWGGEV